MLIVFLLALFGFILLSVPIAFSLVLTAVVLMLYTGTISFSVISQSLIRGIDNFPLLAIPFFILAGEIMNKGGISARIVTFARSLVGHISGGLGFVAVVASMIFAGVSGSAVADTSAIGSVLLPIMDKDRYNREKSTALIAAAGCIGPIIPPSIPMILYGVTAGVSVVKLFLGGIIPGILIGVGLMIAWYVHAKKMGYPAAGRPSLAGVLTAGRDAFGALMLPVIILGGIVFGVATPTEAAVVSVVYAFAVAKFVYNELRMRDMPGIVIVAAKSTAIVLFVCGAATSAAFLITTAQVPELLASTLVSWSSSPAVFMLLVNVLLLLVGCVMDLTPALLILAPILAPIAQKFGLDPVYFGVVFCINLCIGLITPPVGSVLYVACGLSKVSIFNLTRPLLPFILVMVAVLFLITYVPWLIVAIPQAVTR
jgi:TRAP-type transport system large permease protein